MKSLDIKTIAKRVIQIEAEAVSQIQKRVNEDFETAVNAILNCDGRLIVSGMGKSGLISQKIASGAIFKLTKKCGEKPKPYKWQ